MMTVRWSGLVRVSALVLGLLVGCDPGDDPARVDAPPPGPGPGMGEDGEYLSAEARAGQSAPRSAADAGVAAASADSSSAGRTVEEGDIYRVLGPGRLLNLNAFRGLQVIDISDVSQPTLIGKLREAGTPVEMYVIGQRALVLLNGWTGYYGSRTDVKVEPQRGGLVLSVDLSIPSAPVVIDREFVPGSIQTSRLTREGGTAALYVAASIYACWDAPAGTSERSCNGTVVKSFDVSTGDMIPKSRIDLGGYVAAVQGTPSALVVARNEYGGTGAYTSQVSLIDISNAAGTMREGGQVRVDGLVRTKFNLDVRDGFLRVVSTDSWGASSSKNYVTIFDARDLTQPKQAARCTFGDGQQLFATLFMKDRAFFVTYLRQDPFHAFALGADGSCQERTEFVVSGWNNFFRPVFDDRRLIGIGMNDERGRTLSVSLYDVSNLDDPTPLLARAEVAADNSWSSASWDDKAFSVIEDAVSVPAPTLPEQRETGIVLLPFFGFGSDGRSASSGVQIYTFSDRTLTRRGVMKHGTLAKRSFRAAEDLTANLSESELSLFDTSKPDQPVEKGRLELAPSYSKLLDYGAHFVRIHDTRRDYSGWWSQDAAPPVAYAEIIPSSGHPDEAVPVARIAIPAGARTLKVGDLLVSISTQSTYSSSGGQHQSTIRVHDLSSPLEPVELSSLTTDRLLPAYGYGWGYRGGMTCGVLDGSYAYDDYSRVIGKAVVLGRNVPQRVSIGEYESCSYGFLHSQPTCVWDGSAECEWDQGGRYCSRKIDTDKTTCEGELVHCVRKAGATSCTRLDASKLSLSAYCHTSEQYRSWQSMELDVLDLTDPRAPSLKPVVFAHDEEAEGLVSASDGVYFAFKKPHVRAGDDRPYAKYYYRQVDLRDPKSPSVSDPVSVPGELLAVAGSRLITRDLRWGEEVAETWVHALERSGSSARLVKSEQFGGRSVEKVLLDDRGHLFVSHGELTPTPYYPTPSSGTSQAPLDRLSIYTAQDLGKLGEAEVDGWADMVKAIDGRLLFGVPGGFLVVNAQSPSAPYAQAFFPYGGWLEELSFHAGRILLAAGPYGVHSFDATTHNLLSK